MALSLKTLFSPGPAAGREEDNAEFDEPTTQVKMSKQQTGYDPLAAVSIMLWSMPFACISISILRPARFTPSKTVPQNL